jgi:hypothetical protein
VPARIHVAEVIPFLLVLWISLKSAGVLGGAIAWSARSSVDALALFWVCRIRWAVPRTFLVGVALLLASFLLVMLAQSTSTARVAGDLVIVAATIAWTWSFVPNAARLRVRRRRLREDVSIDGHVTSVVETTHQADS